MLPSTSRAEQIADLLFTVGSPFSKLIRVVELAHQVRDARMTGMIDSDFGATEGYSMKPSFVLAPAQGTGVQSVSAGGALTEQHRKASANPHFSLDSRVPKRLT